MSDHTTHMLHTGVLAGAATLATALAGCATGSASGAVVRSDDSAEICAGVPAKEQELGLRAYREALGPATPLRQRVAVSKGVDVVEERGVQIPVGAHAGLTGAWLGRVATCHAALATAGKLGATNADDPLAVPGVKVTVAETSTGYLVTVEAPSSQASSDVYRRAYAMTTGPAAPPSAQK